MEFCALGSWWGKRAPLLVGTTSKSALGPCSLESAPQGCAGAGRLEVPDTVPSYPRHPHTQKRYVRMGVHLAVAVFVGNRPVDLTGMSGAAPRVTRAHTRRLHPINHTGSRERSEDGEMKC